MANADFSVSVQPFEASFNKLLGLAGEDGSQGSNHSLKILGKPKNFSYHFVTAVTKRGFHDVGKPGDHLPIKGFVK
jgi:hypothetical protein